MRFNRASFVSALAGLLVGAMVVAVLPAGASTGDYAVLGTKNNAYRSTKFVSHYPTKFVNKTAGKPAIKLYVESGSPPLGVNSDVMVADLNADLLDGMDASAFSLEGHPHDWSDLTSGIPADLADGDDDTVYTDPEAVAAILAADGTGSGLDADTLDGNDSGDFVGSEQRCPYGWTAAGFDDEGGIHCGGGVTVDTGGDDPSMVLDAFGYPVIAYGADNDLRLTRCHDPYCISFTVETVDGDSNNYRFTSLQLDASGYPVISYYDDTNEILKLAHCVDDTCTGAPTITTVDDDGNVGAYTSMVLDGSGYPVIAYTDYENANLKVAHCDDANCVSTSIETAASATWTGEYTSMALDASGYPVIAYYENQPSSKLQLAHCSDADCADPVTITTLEGVFISDRGISMVLDALGYPVIAYSDGAPDDLLLAHCGDADCVTKTINTVASEDNLGGRPSLLLDASGFPIIVYRDYSDDELELAVCDDANCASATIYQIDTEPGSGGGTSMALLDGFPVIAHRAVTADVLRVIFP